MVQVQFPEKQKSGQGKKIDPDKNYSTHRFICDGPHRPKREKLATLVYRGDETTKEMLGGSSTPCNEGKGEAQERDTSSSR